MFPLLALDVCADNDIRRGSTFDPFDQTQQDAVVRFIGSVSENTVLYALSNPPSPRSTHTVPHAGDHK